MTEDPENTYGMVAIAISRDRIDMIHWLTCRLHTALGVSAGWNEQSRNRTAQHTEIAKNVLVRTDVTVNHHVYARIQKETSNACDTLRMPLENNTDPSMTDDHDFTPKERAIPKEQLNALKILEQIGH